MLGFLAGFIIGLIIGALLHHIVSDDTDWR